MGEIATLGDIDFRSRQADVIRSIWHKVGGKDQDGSLTQAGAASHSRIMEELKQWRMESLYSADADFIIPSIEKNGNSQFSWRPSLGARSARR